MSRTVSPRADRDAAAPRINSIVELLAADDPGLLDTLRQRYPEQAASLRPGMQLGAAPDGTPTPARIYCDLSREGLRAAERQLDTLLQLVPRRLRRAKRLRLLAAVLTSVTSAGVVAAVFADARLAAKIVSAATFVVSLCSLFAHHLETPVVGGQRSPADTLEELVKIEGLAREARARLAAEEQGAPENCRQIATAVNDIAARVRRHVLFAGLAQR